MPFLVLATQNPIRYARSPFSARASRSKLRPRRWSINLSYRITLELLIRDQTVIPVNVGDHEDLYS